MRVGVVPFFCLVFLACGDDGGVEGGSTSAPPATSSTSSSTTMTPMTEPGSTSSGMMGSTSGAPACSDCAPDRCDEDGRCRRYVFVTADPIAMTRTGIDDANAACQAGAAASSMLPMENPYVAFLATDDLAPWDEIGLDNVADAVFVLADDTVVGTASDLEAGTLQHAIDGDHNGAALHADFADEACGPDPHGVWTGVEASLFSGDCNDWNVEMDGLTGVVGNALATDETWFAVCSSGCSMVEAHVYCFEVPPAP